MKNKVLFILHIPPPVTGAGLVGNFIKGSTIINEAFCADYINLAASFRLDSIGKGGLNKIAVIFKILTKIIKANLKNNYSICYMTLTAKGLGFYKDVMVVAILKMFGKDIIYHFHNKGVKENSRSSFNRMLYRFVFRNTHCILLSPELYTDIAKYVKKDDVYFCPNGIPDIRPVNRELSSSSTACSFLFLSNMMEEKGVYVLLKACRRLKEKSASFECHFIGAWSDVTETMFLKTVEDYGISGYIHVHGKKYGADKVAYFKNADVFVLPTFNDCFPLVLLEAMQYALPVISTFQGGIPSIVIDKETGILIPQQNDSELADAMEKLVADANLRIQIGMAGRKRYEQLFTLPIFENNIKKILYEVIALKKL